MSSRSIVPDRCSQPRVAGEPQCFLEAEKLVSELSAAGFAPDSAVPPDRSTTETRRGRAAELGRP